MDLVCVVLLGLVLVVQGKDTGLVDWMERCECARPTLGKMQSALARYSAGKNGPNPLELDDVIKEITEVAHNCTSQMSCRCPEGYFKTEDGYHCLKVSNDKVDCDEATTRCSSLPSARLAIAKDHRRLTNLADEIRHVEDDKKADHYWIGLSYNRTSGGLPVWTWEDGSTASYSITNTLKAPVKKSLVRIDLNGERQAIERVAISKNYRGKHWKQEKCGRIGRNGQVKKHKYICEYVMFKLEVKAVTTKPAKQGIGLKNNIPGAGLLQE